MRISDVISQCDTIKPNTYSFSQKKKWLLKIETDIRKYAALYSEKKCECQLADKENPELFLDDSKEDIYVYYLISMIDLSNQEYALYNNSAAYFNNLYTEWKKEHRRNHCPVCGVTVRV